MTLLARPYHHLGLAVPDLHAGIELAVAAFGAGPFFVAEHMELPRLTHRGGPARLDHSAAFGQWGPTLLELDQLHSAEPASLADTLTRGNGLGHVAWLVDDLAAESARLEKLGLPEVTTGGNDHVSTAWHDATAVFGRFVEVIERSDAVLGFYARVAAAAQGWVGREPVRPLA